MWNNQCQELLREKIQVLRDLIVITSFYDEGQAYSDMVTEKYERLYQIDEALKAL